MANKKVVTFLDIANNNGTFDVGESVGAAVFAHVTSTRDRRLSLGCGEKLPRLKGRGVPATS